MLTPTQIAEFERDGAIAIRGGFPSATAQACADQIWQATGCDPDDPRTWTEPVVRLTGLATPPFVEAANTAVLHEAFDQLVGPGNWIPRTSLGTIPVRFPHDRDPGDAGWHVEASFAAADGGMRTDLGSRGRALLMLFLFSEVTADDAPTRLRLGSHLDVPDALADHGAEGRDWMDACRQVVPASEHRPTALATGSPGDVFLCHPFLVHAAQPHRGTRPRLMAQPPLQHHRAFDLGQPDPPPVVRAIVQAGNRPAHGPR